MSQQYPMQPQQQVIYQQVVRAASNGQAVAAMVLGICAIFFGISVPIPIWGLFMLFLAAPLAIVGVALGHVGLVKSQRINVGRGSAVTGLVLSYVTLGICVLTIGFWVVLGASGAAAGSGA